MIPHIPVMLNEVMEHLNSKDNAIYIDCTFGAGGYSKAILESSDCKLYSIDQDPGVITYADHIKQKYSSKRFVFINRNFVELEEIAQENNLINVDAIVFDLGISSMQIDQAERGFSFQKEAKLDMRMSQNGLDAWQVVNNFSEEELADIIYYYGEEPFSRRIARNIVEARKRAPINTTIELAKIIKSSVKRQGKIDPATKSFQAIRMYVNDELKVLKKALLEAYNLLKIDGKLIIVSFQGLEDRVIKNFLQQIPHTKAKMFKPTSAEIKQNPRSRSAKLRVIVRNNLNIAGKSDD